MTLTELRDIIAAGKEPPLVPAYHSRSDKCAHLTTPDGWSLCGTRPPKGRWWIGQPGTRYADRRASKPECYACRYLLSVATQLAAQGSSDEPGVIGRVRLPHRKGTVPVAACCDCERVLPIIRRGLCQACESKHRREGTISEFGWTRADRLTEYLDLRNGGLGVAAAALRMGLSSRTCQRYEAALRNEGQAVSLTAEHRLAKRRRRFAQVDREERMRARYLQGSLTDLGSGGAA